MNKLRLILACLFLVTSEVVYPNFLKIYNIAPDLSLIFVIFVSLYYGWYKGAISGFLAGLVKDSFSASGFGREAVLLCIIGIISGRLSDIIYKENSTANFIIVFLASTLIGIIFAAKLGAGVFVYILYTSCLAPLVFKFLKKAI